MRLIVARCQASYTGPAQRSKLASEQGSRVFDMSLQAVARMVLPPAVFAVAVAAMLRSLSSNSLPLARAAFVAAQLVVLAYSQRRLARAERRLAALRSRRRQLRSER